MSMALINDDSIFELEGDDDLFLAPMEPARARLNQTMAVLAPVLNDFYDEGPGPDEIIDKLRLADPLVCLFSPLCRGCEQEWLCTICVGGVNM